MSATEKGATLYERSPVRYVLKHVCRKNSSYTSNQRLLLLVIAGHMGRRREGQPVCFVSYRKLEQETHIGRTAIKVAMKGIKAAKPPILKLERAGIGKRLQTNGILHGCYRFTLLRIPKTVERNDDVVSVAVQKLAAARREHLAKLVSEGLPAPVGRFLTDVTTTDD